MSEKIINLGKVKGRTLELKVEDNIIKKKYDDETEWQPLVDLGEAGSSIDTVSGYSELPTDAKENDVAIVEEEEYVRTENKTIVLPIEVKLPAEDQEIPNIYNINFKDSFNSILNNEEVKSLGQVLNVRLDTETRDIMYVDIGAEFAPMMAGVGHPVQIVAVMNGEENMDFYVSGISIRDFLQLMMELELEEEQWATLLGSHANDNSADSPSYGWVNMVISTEPINDKSLDMGDFYATLLFNSEAPKITDILAYASVGIMNTSGESIDASASLYSTYDSSSDVDPEEQAFVLKFVNLALNNIAHGGIIEYSNDIYNPKGLFQNDNGEWVSLEAKMNTPRFVDTYADLPKTSIENGIMAVAKESIYRSEPELTTKLETLKKYRINSMGDMTVEIFDNIIEEILPGYPTTGNADIGLYLITLDENTELGLYLNKYFYNGVVPLYYTMIEVNNYETHKGKQIAYFTEAPDGFEAGDSIPPDKDSGETLEFYPEVGKWYWCDIINDDKNVYSVGGIHEGFPIDLPDELLFYDGEIYWDEDIYPATASEVSTYESDSTYRKNITSIDLKVFNFEDLSSSVSITYPAGFYRYNNGTWNLIKAVSGDEFANKDVLDMLTAEDIGNIQENTEKRHEHSNKYYLDQIGQYTLDNIRDNTNARHTHNNLNQLNRIAYTTFNDIDANTFARHTHKNKTILDKFSLNDNDELLYDDTPVPKTIKYLTLYGVSEVALERGVCKDVDDVCNNPLIITEIPVGESWLTIRPVANATRKEPLKISFPYNIVWENGICPVFRATNTLYIKFYRIEGSSQDVHAQYYSHPDARIDSRLLPPNVDFKFAQISDSGTIAFAPARSYDGYAYNDDDTPIKYGYKKVLGENPIELSRSLKPDDECQLMFKEYDDFIIVYWIITPKGYRIGEYVNSSTITSWNSFFAGYKGSELDVLGTLDTSNCIRDFQSMFYNCKSLLRIPYIDTSNGTWFNSMFNGCSSLIEIPYLDISKGTGFDNMFKNCTSLIKISTLVVNSVSSFTLQYVFMDDYRCPKNLEIVNIEGTIKVNSNFNLTRYSNLSAESLMSFINAFEDNTGEEITYTVRLGSTNLAKLTEEQKLIATNKNILLA